MCSGPPNFASALKLAEAPGARIFLQTDSTAQAQGRVQTDWHAFKPKQVIFSIMSRGDAANGILQAKLLGTGTADVLAAVLYTTSSWQLAFLQALTMLRS